MCVCVCVCVGVWVGAGMLAFVDSDVNSVDLMVILVCDNVILV